MSQVPIISSSGLELTSNERLEIEIFESVISKLSQTAVLSRFILDNPTSTPQARNTALVNLAGNLEQLDSAEIRFLLNVRTANNGRDDLERLLDRADEASYAAVIILDEFDPIEVPDVELPFQIPMPSP